MGEQANSMPQGDKQLLVVVVGLGGLVLMGILAFVFYVVFGGDRFGDEISISNHCDVEVLASSERQSGYSVSAFGDPAIAPGATGQLYAEDAISVHVFGGPWTMVPVGEDNTVVLAGDACPVPAGPADRAVVVVRAPLLSNAQVSSVTVKDSSSWPFAREDSEVTEITAQVSPELAAQWASTYETSVTTNIPPGFTEILEEASPGAQWQASRAFAAALHAEGLSAFAFLDPATGVVVAQVWEPNPNP